MVRVAEAEANWTELLDRVDAGEEVVIERSAGRPIQLKVVDAGPSPEPRAESRWALMTPAERMAWLEANTVDWGYEFDATAAIREDRDAKDEQIARLLGR